MKKKLKHFCLNRSNNEIINGLNIDNDWNIQDTKINYWIEQNRWWEAFSYCYSIDNKKGYITNWEYESEIKFCPICWFEFVDYQKEK